MLRPLTDRWATTAVDLTAWRDYDHTARTRSGMALGPRSVGAPWSAASARLYAEGARCVRIDRPVRLCPGATVSDACTLVLIRELTGLGFAVEWTARCSSECGGTCARRYGHLYPPEIVLDAATAVATEWRTHYFPGRCCYRHGPGFVEVRDHRAGQLEVYTVDDPRHLAAIATMVEGAASCTVPDDVCAELVDADLVSEHAGYRWWHPVRVQRWPFPPMIV